MKLKIKSAIIYWFYRFMMATWRIRMCEHPEVQKLIHDKKPLILAHWHGDEYSLFHLVKPYRLATMTSTSRDGAVVDHLIKKLGGETSRGSSTRGAVSALKGLIRLLRQGRITSIAVDGPRGPYHVVKPGVFEIARMCDGSIIPVGVHVESALRFKKSWNQAYLPYPFAKIQIVFDAPFKKFNPAQDPRDESLALALAEGLDDARRQAANLFAAP